MYWDKIRNLRTFANDRSFIMIARQFTQQDDDHLLLEECYAGLAQGASTFIFWQMLAKFRSFSVVSAPIFASKYAFSDFSKSTRLSSWNVWNLATFCRLCNICKMFAEFQKFQLANLVDLENSWKTRICLQRSVPIQPKTSNILPEFWQNFVGELNFGPVPGAYGRAH